MNEIPDVTYHQIIGAKALPHINQTAIKLFPITFDFEDTNKNISEMKVGILGFFDLQKRKRLDDLEAMREKKNNQAATISSVSQEVKKDSSDGFNLGNFLGGLTFGNLLTGAGKLFSLAFLAKLYFFLNAFLCPEIKLNFSESIPL